MEAKKRPVMPAEGEHLLALPLTLKKKKKSLLKRGERRNIFYKTKLKDLNSTRN